MNFLRDYVYIIRQESRSDFRGYGIGLTFFINGELLFGSNNIISNKNNYTIVVFKLIF